VIREHQRDANAALERLAITNAHLLIRQ
jgi:hypothetical protein